MARKLRYVPEGGSLVEVTCRTLHGRLVLRPSPELNDIIGGILGRFEAQDDPPAPGTGDSGPSAKQEGFKEN